MSFLFSNGCVPYWFKHDYVIIIPSNKIGIQGSYETIFADRKESILKYIENHPNLSDEIKDSMLHYCVRKKMTKEQVKLITGEPTKIKDVKDDKQIWIYSQILGSGEEIKLLFDDKNILVEIDKFLLEPIF